MTATRPSTTISAVLIVKDEEAVLAESLEAIRWVDQIVVYDTGSTDATREIAARYTETVVEGYWDDDFGAARNRALEHATGEWILVVDADEVFQADPQSVRARLAARTAELWTVPVEGVTETRGQLDGPTVTIRVFPRGLYQYKGRLHEQVVPAHGTRRGVIEALANARIVHSGYTEEAVTRHDKRRRNLEISRQDLADAEARGASPVELSILRANLSRSLVMATEVAEGLELAEAVLADGHAPDGTTTQLAASAVKAACVLGDHDAIERWIEVWKTADYSPVWAVATHVRVAQVNGDRQRAIELLETLPTTLVDPAGRRFVKHSLADIAVWALAGESRHADAVRVATEAARAGFTSVAPGDLVRIVERTRRTLREVVAQIHPSVWREYALSCVRDASDRARLFLKVMDEVRPEDASVLMSASALAYVMTVEELATWSAALRRVGLEEHCPMVAAAHQEGRSARERALLAAMAFDIYRDERALPALEAALAQVPAAEEASLLTELDIVAPGLVTPTAV